MISKLCFGKRRQAISCSKNLSVLGGRIGESRRAVFRGESSSGKDRRGDATRDKVVSGGGFKVDAYVFACGPWMPKLFPDLLTDTISISRQEIHYFGLPAYPTLTKHLTFRFG
ncbi:hypothetical protein D5R40_33625 [Okeania hirsuta]|uniref:FAD-dependent oxidoreductase n=1 Tax=Okeania hirsuta TaxID=1458930 RepID=A0A3N6NX23_9CYAN|nr:hypothetical protein D5R40_33625 [Okeania hirsuta]